MARSPEQIWRPVAEAELARRGVTAGTGFGQNEGLRVGGRIFAMLVRDELVVKLPRERVDQLVDAGVATRFDAGKGRPMKEWASITPDASRRWRGLVEEARAFVAGYRPELRTAAGSSRSRPGARRGGRRGPC